jgi:hypothetical protein
MRTSIKASIIVLFIAGTSLKATAQFSQWNARDFINKTSYIIGEAYDIVYYYGYYSSGYLSKAVNHQNYAKYLYNIRDYRYAIYHSDLARSYALRVIYNSTNYWNNYYRPYYYYSPPRPYYVNNHHPQNSYNYNYNYNYNTNTQYGHRSSTSVSSVNRTATSSSRSTSKYASSGNDVREVDFNTWNRNYYSSEETSLLRGVSIPSERELESAIANTNDIRRISDDKTVINNGIRDFSSDIDTYRRSNADEARSISINRPSDFGTTSEVTRSTVNTINPINTRYEQTQPTQTRQGSTTQPTQSRQETTQPTQTRQGTQPAQSTTQPSTKTSSESVQPNRNTTTPSNQQTTPQRSTNPTTNQNTNNNNNSPRR